MRVHLKNILYIFLVFSFIKLPIISMEELNLKTIENNQPIMQEIALHILNDKRSPKRILEKFNEHSKGQYLKWKSSIESGNITHRAKKEDFHVFNDEINPKNIDTIKSLIGNCQLLFRMGHMGSPVFVIEKEYDNKIAHKYVADTSDNSVKEDDTEDNNILVVLLNVEKITSYIIKHGLHNDGWKNLGGALITIFPTTRTFLEKEIPIIQ